MEFPRLVYKSPSAHILVEDVKWFDEALTDGWFASVPEALNAKHDAPVKKDEEKPVAEQETAPAAIPEHVPAKRGPKPKVRQ